MTTSHIPVRVLGLASGVIAIAAVIYFALVLPMGKLEARRAGPSTEAPTRECPECLSKIPAAARRCAFCTASVPPVGVEPTP